MGGVQHQRRSIPGCALSQGISDSAELTDACHVLGLKICSLRRLFKCQSYPRFLLDRVVPNVPETEEQSTPLHTGRSVISSRSHDLPSEIGRSPRARDAPTVRTNRSARISAKKNHLCSATALLCGEIHRGALTSQPHLVRR